MKKFYLLFVVLMGFGSVSGQVINLPDGVFKAELLNSYPGNITARNLEGNYFAIDANSNGEIEVSEALQVSSLLVNNSYISSMEGINSFTSLEYLYCNSSGISTLDISALTNLKVLNCGDNLLTSLNVSNLTSLEELNVGHLQISTLNLLGLVNLKKLWVYDTLLTTLDLSSQINLIELNCHENDLLVSTNVSICPLLKKLDVSMNSLTSINVAGLSNLEELRISENQFNTINLTGLSSLKLFDFSANYFEYLNLSALTNLIFFNASGNLGLGFLNVKNGNPNLTGYFDFNNVSLQYVCADEFNISALQQQVNLFSWQDVEVNSYCTSTPGGTYYTLQGSITLDANNNGCDANDLLVPNLKININNSTASLSGVLVANTSGQYNYSVYPGTNILTPVLENPTYFTVSPTTTTVTFPESASPFNQNFCITPNGLHPDLEVIIIPTNPALPGFDADYKLVIKNKGNIQQSGSVSFTYNDAVLDYVSANPLVTTQATGTMTWDFATLQPFETREISLTLNVNSPMETPAVNADDILNYTATITSAATDDMPLDNTFSLPQIVVNSFDPNDKTCLEGTSITPDMIGKYVHYMIRFENTGTFPAENIVVKDMIDATKFDVASLIPLNASHDYTTRITGNKVEFIFENINLPFEDATNDGYIVFKIKTLPTLALGDSFSNSASIYFDYNFPIVTDPAVTTFATLATQDFVFNNYLTVYPNPTNDVLNLTAKQAIELKSMSVYNVVGQLVLSVPNAKGVSTIDVSNLTVGTYFLKVVSDKGTSNVKFMKK